VAKTLEDFYVSYHIYQFYINNINNIIIRNTILILISFYSW